MVKYTSIFGLQQGFAPDESYQIWRKHAVRVKEILKPELKQYTTGRVVASFGESGTYGITQMLFDDPESWQQALKRMMAS